MYFYSILESFFLNRREDCHNIILKGINSFCYWRENWFNILLKGINGAYAKERGEGVKDNQFNSFFLKKSINISKKGLQLTTDCVWPHPTGWFLISWVYRIETFFPGDVPILVLFVFPQSWNTGQWQSFEGSIGVGPQLSSSKQSLAWVFRHLTVNRKH